MPGRGPGPHRHPGQWQSIINGAPGTDCAIGYYAQEIPRNGGSRGVGADPNGPSPAAGTGPGAIDGTPIGLLTDTALNQSTDGAALQAKLETTPASTSWSAPRWTAATRATRCQQQLGLIDAEHRVYADPDHIDPFYRAGQVPITGNLFHGTETTYSAYFNET
ncbi:MAG: hypothetical protein WDO12_01395 [Pseudomonadota bacterium]